VVYANSHLHIDRYEPELLSDTLKQARGKHVNSVVSQAMNMRNAFRLLGVTKRPAKLKNNGISHQILQAMDFDT
jgi:hypothetical protein